MNISTTHDIPELPEAKPRLIGISLLVGCVLIGGILLLSRFSNEQEQRELQVWQEKLNLIAQSRSDQMLRWVNRHKQEVTKLADNPTLQLTLTEPDSQFHVGQKNYLRTLLTFTAERAGFATPNHSKIAANVTSPPSHRGLLVLDKQGEILVSTMRADGLGALHHHPSTDGLIDMTQGKDGKVYIGFSAPIYALHREKTTGAKIGRVVGFKALDEEFFAQLASPTTGEKTFETFLVRQREGKLDYLTPLSDGSSPLTKIAQTDSEALTLVQSADDFVQMQDYRGQSVLATSRHIAGTPWTLIAKIDRTEAMAKSDARRQANMITFLAALTAFALLLILIWKQAYSKKALLQSQYFQHLAGEAQAKKGLLAEVVNMLVTLVDRRDPFAAHHSQMVSKLAEQVAIELKLKKDQQDTLRIAGSLMNIGKITVPAELLTKTDRLNADEKQRITTALHSAEDLIKDVPFEGPVVETLAQVHERMDGTGPKKLSGENILITARILAAANAFIGMISPRSWRDAMSSDEAAKALLDASDAQFDRHVVVALIHTVENHDGKAWIAECLADQKGHYL